MHPFSGIKGVGQNYFEQITAVNWLVAPLGVSAARARIRAVPLAYMPAWLIIRGFSEPRPVSLAICSQYFVLAVNPKKYFPGPPTRSVPTEVARGTLRRAPGGDTRDPPIGFNSCTTPRGPPSDTQSNPPLEVYGGVPNVDIQQVGEADISDRHP